VSITQRLGALVIAAFAVAFVRLPWLIRRVFNPVLRKLLVTRVPGGPNALLTVRGRRTGQPRTVPVTFLDLGEGGLVQAASDDVNWVRNLRSAGEAVISRGGRTVKMEAVELPAEAAGRLIRELLAPFPRSRLVRAVVGPANRPPVGVLHYFRVRVDDALDDYVALARRQPLFELRGAGIGADGQPG
jgi:deazaflavin-dependent oxidoreductase (nitroreductase family)